MNRLRVHVEPTGTYSRAMTRIAAALRRYAPLGVEFVHRRFDADVCVFYVIGADAIGAGAGCLEHGQLYAPVQCCFGPQHPFFDASAWAPFWNNAVLTWSYYDLRSYIDDPRRCFLHAPLGLDDVFRQPLPTQLYRPRDYRAVTTGYLSGPGAEAIEEVWQALRMIDPAGYDAAAFHVGPSQVGGMKTPHGWQSSEAMSDQALAWMLQRTSWMPALRHVEGLELPAAEGLACGARPILFDQPALRHWYGSHAIYIPECHGESLVQALVPLLSTEPDPVSPDERSAVLATFEWSSICRLFWSMLLSRLENRNQEAIAQ